MLRAATASSSRYAGRQLLASPSSSSLQRLTTASTVALSSSVPSSSSSSRPNGQSLNTRHYHRSPQSGLAAPALSGQHYSREQDVPPLPHKTKAQGSRISKKSASSTSSAPAHTQPTTHQQGSASRSTKQASTNQAPPKPNTSPSTSTSTPPSTSSSSSSPPAPPQPPNPKSGLVERARQLFHQVKFLFKFYLNGVKQVYYDGKRVSEIKKSVKDTGRQMAWSEKRLLRVHSANLSKLPLFLAILIILEEILPLVVIYAPNLLPSTCILPSQLLKIRQTEEIKRSAAIEKLRRSKEVRDLMTLAGWSISKAGDRQDTIEAVQKVFPLHGEKGKDISQRLRTLSKDTLIDFCRVFSLSTTLRTASMMRDKLEAHLKFLAKDDLFLRGHESSATSPNYAEVPEEGPILAEISSERGMRCVELESRDMFENMRDWLKVTSVFSPASNAATPTASPIQLLLLPLLLYPSPLFTPSLKQLKAREADEASKGIRQRSKDVAQEVIKAEENKARMEQSVQSQEKRKAQGEKKST